MQNVTKSFDYHQPDLSVNRSVYASCLSLDSVIGQLKGQLTRRACVSGQNALCACAVLTFRRVNCFWFFFFFMKTYN